MNTDRIPMEWVIGPDEVTVWLWPNSADPTTVRFTVHEWAKIERKCDRLGVDVEEQLAKLISEDLEEHADGF